MFRDLRVAIVHMFEIIDRNFLGSFEQATGRYFVVFTIARFEYLRL